MWALVDPWPGPGNQRLLTPLCWPWDVRSVHVLLRLSGLCMWLTPIKAGWCGELLILRPPKTSLIYRFRCLLKPQSTNLECSASFFGLSLPSVKWGLVLNITQGTPKNCKPTIGKPARDGRNGSWERGIHRGNPELATDLFVGRGGA